MRALYYLDLRERVEAEKLEKYSRKSFSMDQVVRCRINALISLGILVILAETSAFFPRIFLTLSEDLKNFIDILHASFYRSDKRKSIQLSLQPR